MRITQLAKALSQILLFQLVLQHMVINSAIAMPMQKDQKRLGDGWMDNSNGMGGSGCDNNNDCNSDSSSSGMGDSNSDSSSSGLGDSNSDSSSSGMGDIGNGCNSDTDDFNNCKKDNDNGPMLNKGNAKKTATNIAQKAAHDAEQAYGTQQSAAAQVAHMVKKQLADRAYSAAKSAEAALSGKQQNVEQLEVEMSESEAAMQQQSKSLMTTHNNVNAAAMSVKDAQQLCQVLHKALNVAQENLGHAKVAANGAQHELEEKTQLMEQTKARIEALNKRLCESRKELQLIKKSAFKAYSAAAEARKKSRERRAANKTSRIKRDKQQLLQEELQQQKELELHNSGAVW